MPHSPTANPPSPALLVHRVTTPYGVREDPFYWLRDDTRSDPQVLTHLRAETAYAEAVLAPAQPLIERLYQEIVGRIKEDDSSVPVRYRGYWYASRFVSGGQYAVIVRWPDPLPSLPRGTGEGWGGGASASEVVLLDCNTLAVGQTFFQLGGYESSPDNTLLAYTEDTVGRRQFRIRFKDIASGELLGDVIENAEPDVAWADDNRTLLYVEKDPVTLLGRRVRAHVLGTPVATDRLVYEEPDESFDLVVMRSKSERHLYIGSESTTTSEWRYAPTGDPALSFAVVVPREADHEYQIEDLDERLLIRTNWQAQNFRIVAAPLAACGERARWRDVVPHDAAVFLQAMDVFRDFLAVNERSGGLLRIRVQRWSGGEPFYLAADDPTYTMMLGSNPELETSSLRYVYTSLTTPATTYDYDVRSGERVLRKREPVLGAFDPANYTSELLWAPARDGELVPVSVVHRKDRRIDGTAPLYLYAYGSYGLSADPVFSSTRLSLLDRGFVYAIAHVRGGQERGRRWYEAGRLKHKWNTFNDFIDVTDFLVARGYGARDRVFAAGGSAGGLLVGVIANVAPDRYRGLIAHVPFVDIVTTMLDDSIPLTTLEYEEWGNPHEKQYYEYMLSYSPYDNVRKQAYPAMLVTTGLWDSQVQYYEPAKWVAKLRAANSGNQALLLHVNLQAGHGGKSGRYERLREVAREYGFILSLGGDL